jgi:hypothetical protein
MILIISQIIYFRITAYVLECPETGHFCNQR